MKRCIALNNPMSIEHSKDAWDGESTLQDDPTFVRYITPEKGIRAGMKTLLTYQRKHDLEHIAAFITRYAPPTENNTAAYIDDVCQHCGVKSTDYFDVEIPDNLIRLAQAIVHHEQGAGPDHALPFWFSESVYETAAKEALS